MQKIWILGIGWREDDLTLGTVKRLRSGKKIFLRTGRCECADWLKSEKIPFETLDFLYERCYDFDELIDQSVEIIMAAAEAEDVVYCVNDLSDKTCSRLCELAYSHIILGAGVSEGTSLFPFAGNDLRIISASDADTFEADVHMSTLIRELDNPMLASDIKLKLTERYPDELDIYVCDASGQIRTISLCDLDRLDDYDHRMCALIPAVHDLDKLERYDVRHLEEIMQRLRDYDGCPWDREQTHESLRSYLIEEAYEAVDAINRDSPDDLYDELGDVLLQIIFHADIAKQYGEFELSDVTTAICKKMIRRHPHVFAGASAENANDVVDMWSEIKKQEKAHQSPADTMRAVAGSLPALMRAAKVCKRARQNSDAADTAPCTDEAWAEWRATKSSESLGQLLMLLADEANQSDIDAELSLTEAIERYIRRFEESEK